MTDTCQHDPMYRIENEAAGGIGCPICRRERLAQQAAPTLDELADECIAESAVTQLDDQCAALLAQHNADVDERKAAGGKRYGGMTYISTLEGLK